ncbi:MAG: hypothetical protein NZ602_09620 [Thermoguttaceae bacterium]|nr:hypothetical protein [Thermoguttaceae bacterium]MDW8038732.1 hypothetical protein [Thermoguttaceae bacterium]
MIRCPLCRRQLTERDRQVGRCASCGQAVPGWARLAGAAEGSASGGKGGQTRWWAGTAGFALLVPGMTLVLDRLFQRQWAAEPTQAEQIQAWLGMGLLVVILAFLGAVGGLVAAWRAKAWRLAAWSGLALLANGLVLAAWAAGKLFKTP